MYTQLKLYILCPIVLGITVLLELFPRDAIKFWNSAIRTVAVLSFILYACPICAAMCAWYQRRPGKGPGSTKTKGVGYKPQCGCWESNLCPPQEEKKC